MGGSHGYTLNFRTGTGGSGNVPTLSNISRTPTEKEARSRQDLPVPGP